MKWTAELVGVGLLAIGAAQFHLGFGLVVLGVYAVLLAHLGGTDASA